MPRIVISNIKKREIENGKDPSPLSSKSADIKNGMTTQGISPEELRQNLHSRIKQMWKK